MGLFDQFVKQPQTVTASDAAPESKTAVFTFNALPESTDELRSLPEAALDEPYQTAALTVLALCAYAASPDLGIEMLNFLKGPQPLSPYEKQFLADRFRDKKYVPFSYFEGAVPENDYTPSSPLCVTVSANPYSFKEDGYALLYIRSGGADNPRSVKLRAKGGKWYLWEQFLLPDIRAPKASDTWA